MSSDIKDLFRGIISPDNISDDKQLLEKYSKDLSFVPSKMPLLVIYPKSVAQIQEIIKITNEKKLSIIPISSSNKYRFHGDTIPKTDNAIILDLSKMNEIIRVDLKNRVIMIEPGVTFGELIKVAKENGLRLNKPLYPRSTKSVLASVLEREPPLMPKYQWDTSDPLLCTQVVFGTGDLFRTGAAAGPGTIEEQLETGQAMKNPMGPTQFSPFRLLQGAQGTMGVVTWVTIKCEYLNDLQKLKFAQSDTLNDLFGITRHVIRYRMADEILILNKTNLAALLDKNLDELKDIKEWILIFNITGQGKFAQDKIDYIEADINDILPEFNINLSDKLGNISNDEIYTFLQGTCNEPWQLKYRGGFQDIFYVTTLDRTPEQINLVKSLTNLEIGVYIQPLAQGNCVHCEFNLFYDPSKVNLDKVKEDYLKISRELMKKGAFFHRPYGLWADDVYSMVSDEVVDALKKLKAIFDPNNVMKPGNLCFKEE